jgi:transcriptional regulator with XRE-family HTH domain
MAAPIKKTKNIPKPTHFGKNLKFLRKLSGLNQTQLADHLGLTRNNVASYESGLVEPNMKKYLATCRFFNIPPKDMLDSILSDHMDDLAKVKSEDPIDHYIVDQIEEFILQTNEMTKVIEGYKAFYQMKRESETYRTNKGMHAILEDLLELLSALSAVNWEFVEKVYPHKLKNNQ